MHLTTRKIHATSTNTTRRLHTFYAHAGAAIPWTSTVVVPRQKVALACTGKVHLENSPKRICTLIGLKCVSMTQ